MTVARTAMPARLPASAARLRNGAFEFPDLVRLVDRRRRLILAVAAVCVALTAAVLVLLPTLYSACAVVMLEQRRNNVADASSVLSSLPTDPASVQNQIQILTSRDLASRVVGKLGLENDSEFNGAGLLAALSNANADTMAAHERVINAFLNRLSVENEGLSTAIAVSFKARTPEKAAQIANAVAETYVQAQLDTKFAATHEATEWLENRVRDLSREVQSSDAAVERYKAEHNLNETAGGVPLIEQQISGISTQLVQAKADFAQKQATFARVGGLMKAGQAADISQVVASPLIIQLRSQEADLMRSEADLQTRYGPKHPKYIAIESQKHDLEQKIAQEVARLTGSLANDVSVTRAQVASLESSLAQAEHEAQAQNLMRVRLKSLEVNAASMHSIYEAFVARLRSIQDQDAIEASDAHVISHAAAPNAPSSPHRFLILTASVPASLMLGVLIALLFERFAPRFQTQKPDPLRGIPVIAEIAGMAHVRAADLVVDWPGSPYARAVGDLAQRIVYAAARGGPRVVLVTSPRAGEGTATTAVSVARAAANLGRRVVVVDANLTSPAVMSVAGISGVRNGLIEILSARAPLSAALLRDSRSNTLLLSPKRPRDDVRPIFASAQLRQLIDHLRSTCDLLLIVAPPVLSQTGAMLARHADAVMLVARADLAPRQAVGHAVDALARASARQIGIVVAS